MLGISTICCSDVSLGTALYKISRVKGIDFVEIVSENYHMLDRYNYHSHMETLEENGLKSVIHAPFSDINIASLNERIRRASLDILFEAFEIARLMGALLVVIHPGHLSPAGMRFPKAYEKIHRRSLKEIDRYSRKLGIRVALENMPAFPTLDGRTCERIRELIDGTELYVTFDVGHLNTVTQNFDEFIELLGDRIIHVHLHDNNGKNDSHLSLGKGNVPWNDVFKLLPRKASWSLELGSLDAVRESLRFIKTHI
ncbi:sugar phosphate isomerase/epimerase family protein [Thermococcus sp.]